MERLGLWLVGPEDRAFAQYVPGNLRPLLGREDTVCVGAVYEGMACGAALAELERGGSCYLRYLFVDPAARLCGLGTYLLRGLMGKARELGACQVKALYTPSMLERKDQPMGVLERAGFSRPKPVATQFSAWLGDIPGVKFPEVSDLKVYSALELPQNLWEVYSRWQQEGELPGFVDISMLENPERELSSFCAIAGQLAGVFLIDRRENGLQLSGLYLAEVFRRSGVAAALLSRSIRKGRERYPADTEVWTSTLNRDSFSLCSKLLLKGEHGRKETEFYCEADL